MAFWKFEDMLTKSALYFARQDRFPDQFEGRFREGNSADFSAADRAFYEACRINRTIAEAKAQHEIHRQCVFISCWHRNTKESRKMWETMGAGNDGVVVATSAKALSRFIPDEITKFPVRYRGPDIPITELGWSTLAFYKLPDFSYEREFRMVRNLRSGESVRADNPADHGRYVEVPLKKIVHRVITHPQAYEQAKQKVEDLLRKHLRGLSRENSALEGL